MKPVHFVIGFAGVFAILAVAVAGALVWGFGVKMTELSDTRAGE